MALLKISNGSKVKLFGKTKIPTYGYGSGDTSSGLLANLMAFYRLDDNADSSGNGNHMSISSGGVNFSSAGKIGNAATFTGNPLQYLSNSSLSFTSKTAISLAAWVKRSSTAGGARNILSTGGVGNNSNGVGLYADEVNGLKWVPFNNTELPFSSELFTNDVWFHTVLVGTRSGSVTSWTLYINGSAHDMVTASGWFDNSSKNGLLIGRSNEGQNAIGQIDAVGIWSRALTVGDISDLYNSGGGLEI